MKKVIRRNVYETNSSSCHAIQISSDGLRSSEFKLDKDGYIHCDYGCFDESGIYDTQYEKLSYLLTHAWFDSNDCYSINDQEIYDSYHFTNIQDAIIKYIPGCKGIKIDMRIKPELNHQLYGDNIVNTWSRRAVIDFVFNSYISLNIYHD